jgi:hypothetical protein
MLRIELEGAKSAYRPGEKLLGMIRWQHPKPPSELTATLVWYTEGKGDSDSDEVLSQSWAPSGGEGSMRIVWMLPRGPLSHFGSLIRIRWRIEVECYEPDESVSQEIVLSHTGRPIRTSELQVDANATH